MKVKREERREKDALRAQFRLAREVREPKQRRTDDFGIMNYDYFKEKNLSFTQNRRCLSCRQHYRCMVDGYCQ